MKLLADENLDNTIIRGLLRRNPSIDILRVQDVGLSGVDDPAVLAWAADDNRILLTHDVATITRYAYKRVATNLPMPGVIEIRTDVAKGKAIDDICLILECSTAEDLDGQIYYIPP
jgi:predicted nuclease of predicted toxin-antitoxin system